MQLGRCFAPWFTLAALTLAASAEAAAATFAVNDFSDEVDADIGDGRCDINVDLVTEECTLRAAIQEANASPAEDLIQFALSGTVILTRSGTDDTAQDGDLDVTAPLVIEGLAASGGSATIIDGGGAAGTLQDRIFHVIGGALTLRKLRITGGYRTAEKGGALRVLAAASVTLEDCVVTGNLAELGGGIASAGTTQLVRTAIDMNNLVGSPTVGAGMWIDAGTTTLESSTVSRNGNAYPVGTTAAFGGGIHNAGTLVLKSSTVSGNVLNAGNREGTAIHNTGTLTLRYSTIYNNGSGRFAVGFSGVQGNITLQGSVLWGNGGTDCLGSGVWTSLGHNDLGITCADHAISSDFSLDPKLSPLGDNGGPTETHAPTWQSPLLTLGNAAGCAPLPLVDGDARDQRGQRRSLAAPCVVGAVSSLFLVVDEPADMVDADTSAANGGLCAVASGGCSLRAAIQEANFWGGVDRIHLPALGEDAVLSLAGSAEDNPAAGDLDLTGPVEISGAGALVSHISAGPAFGARVFHAKGAFSWSLRDVSISGADTADSGAAIANEGADVRLDGLAITGNASGGIGGAIWNTGTASLAASVLGQNEATSGGAIANAVGASFTLLNTTLSGNIAAGEGGALHSLGQVSARNVTAASNSAATGGGLALLGGVCNSKHVILAGNSATAGPDCSSASPAYFVSAGYNLVGNATGCAWSSQTSDQIGSGAAPLVPGLEPLADNGGQTQTRAISGSNLVADRGDPAGCKDIAGNALTVDQRGEARPSGLGCDLGAYEAETTDLALSLVSPQTSYAAGDAITYTLTASNNGPSGAESALVSLTFPAELESVTWTCSASQGSSCAAASGTGAINHSVTLRSGGSATFAISAVIATDATGPSVVTASITTPASLFETVPASNTATSSDDLVPRADLGVTQLDLPDPAAAGTTVTYFATVENLGPGAAPNVVTTSVLPNGAELISATPSVGTCALVSGSVLCELGVLGSGAGALVTLAVKLSAPGLVYHDISVASDAFDPEPDNDLARENTTVTPSANLSVTLSAAPNPVRLGEPLTYTVTVHNAGPASATDVILEHALGDVTVIATETSQGSCGAPVASTVSCALGLVAAGADVALSLTVAPNGFGTLVHGVNVHGADPDLSPLDNSAEASVEVPPQTNLVLSMTSDPATEAGVGDVVTLAVVVSNPGPAVARIVPLTLEIPPAMRLLTFVPSRGQCDHFGALLSCATSDLAVGAALSVQATFSADSAGLATWLATSEAVAQETDPSDNTRELTLTVLPAGQGSGSAIGDGTMDPGTVEVKPGASRGCGCHAHAADTGVHVLGVLLFLVLRRRIKQQDRDHNR